MKSLLSDGKTVDTQDIINDLNKSLSDNIINIQEYERIKSMILSADDEVVEVGVNLVLSMREKRFNNGARTS